MLLSCIAPNVFAVDGFGQATTGGAGGSTVTVTTAADFQTYVETDSPYIVQVSGTIDLASLDDKKVRIHSNTTIRGVGENPTIIGELGCQNDSSNIIIERLNITCPSGYGEGDGISIKEDITNVFITKCTIYNCYDGCVDITRRSDYITVSWCKFYFDHVANNDRVSLVGGGDTHDDEGKLHITFHHNWFSTQCWQRIPSVRYGRVHIYNNYYDCPGNLYCVRSRIKAECLIENNYFYNVNDPYYIYIDDEDPEDYGKIGASGNIIDSCTGQVDNGDDIVFTPPYSYTLDDAKDIPVIVQYSAGADGSDDYPPHWFFGVYGDFDVSGLVDANDLEVFTGYWLDTNDVADINDADYNSDGIVNSYEYALFAGNWLAIPPDLTPPATPTNLTTSDGDGIVLLDWDNNSEDDLDGYNIYRSTTFGSGYVQQNIFLLSDSNYIDNSVVNGTIYYYVVTAVDTSSNESGYSSQVSAIPTDANSIIIQENEIGFCGLDGDVETEEHSGYTGYGYANTDNDSGNGINWSINITTAGSYTFKWRYANASSDRPARLLINSSEEVSNISFPGTGAWESWSEVSVGVTLATGIKDIRLEATGGDGLANIDYLMVTGSEPEIASCP
jgi:pectate lyase